MNANELTAAGMAAAAMPEEMIFYSSLFFGLYPPQK